MRIFLIAAFSLALAAPTFAETWKNAPMVDGLCGSNAKKDADKHTAACTKHCSRTGGVGILTADGTFLKFDAKGQKTALDLLEKSGKKDHIRADVTGERKGTDIIVETVALK
ncbi:MAG TPA: hypothetical protein VN428_07660 [Bryobacteraceae bacterium]|nr:hypothetical protein [Bryobacteraceae bacterium]